MTDPAFTSFIADMISKEQIVLVWPDSKKDNPTTSLGCSVNAGTVDNSNFHVFFLMVEKFKKVEITAIKLLDVKMPFLKVIASGDNLTKCFGS